MKQLQFVSLWVVLVCIYGAVAKLAKIDIGTALVTMAALVIWATLALLDKRP